MSDGVDIEVYLQDPVEVSVVSDTVEVFTEETVTDITVDPQSVVESLSEVRVVQVEVAVGGKGPKGDPGPVGPPGGITTFSAVNLTGSTLGGHRLVTVDQVTGGLVYSDCTVANQVGGPVGILTTSVEPLATGSAVLSGVVSDPSWSWTTPSELYIGQAGLLVHFSGLPVGALVVRQIATVLSPTTVFIDSVVNFILEE